jgi:hypothetical protein
MAIVETVKYKGQTSTSTLSGDIRLEQGRGRLVVYDPDTQVELTVLDRTGFLFSDGTDRRIKLGSYATRVGLWISKEGEDVIDLLEG